MVVSLLELKRAQKQLSGFCERRNALTSDTNAWLQCEREGTALTIVQCGIGARALVRLVYQGQGWDLFWPREDGTWDRYPHLEHAADIHTVIEELEQAPLHVHWD